MILSELRGYLQATGRATIGEMAVHFDTEPQALRGMLETWMKKGKVRLAEGAKKCGGCNKCDDYRIEIYEWVG